MKKRIISAILSLAVMFTAASSYSEPSQRAEATANTMNIIPYYDATTVVKYGAPSMFLTRFPYVANRVKGFYNAAFSIHLNFSPYGQNGSMVITTQMSNCLQDNNLSQYYDKWCQHYNSVQTDETMNLFCTLYHHTNKYKVKNYMLDNYSFDSSNYVALYLTCGKICNYNAAKAQPHYDIYGCAFPSQNIMLVRDYDYTKNIYEYYNFFYRTIEDKADTNHSDYVSKTLAHEIGHFYGAPDHYDITYGDDRDYCIYGKYKSDSYVAYHFSLCSDCYNTIYSNRGNYNHS